MKINALQPGQLSPAVIKARFRVSSARGDQSAGCTHYQSDDVKSAIIQTDWPIREPMPDQGIPTELPLHFEPLDLIVAHRLSRAASRRLGGFARKPARLLGKHLLPVFHFVPFCPIF
jgi:hypothetical protein